MGKLCSIKSDMELIMFLFLIYFMNILSMTKSYCYFFLKEEMEKNMLYKKRYKVNNVSIPDIKYEYFKYN